MSSFASRYIHGDELQIVDYCKHSQTLAREATRRPRRPASRDESSMASRLRNLGVQLSVARSAGEESSTTADVVEAEAEVEAEASPRVQFFHRRRPRANFQAIWTFPELGTARLSCLGQDNPVCVSR